MTSSKSYRLTIYGMPDAIDRRLRKIQTEIAVFEAETQAKLEPIDGPLTSA